MPLPHSKNIFAYPARFQWQSNAPCGGSSACTDTCIQMIIEYYKDRTYSLNTIRKYAQARTHFNEGSCTGINHVEALNALTYFGLGHYRIEFNPDINFVIAKSKLGPVLAGVHYGSYPTKRTRCPKRYNRRHAEISGKTDCPFTGAHAVLVIGSRQHRNARGQYLHTDVYTRDPDHNSPSRREKPAYDRFRRRELRIAIRNLAPYTPFRYSFVLYPTKSK